MEILVRPRPTRELATVQGEHHCFYGFYWHDPCLLIPN